MRAINSTLQQKWFDFTHPTKVEHYGYSFPESQLRQFPEGRALLCGRKREQLQMRRLSKCPEIKRMGRQMGKTFDKLVLQVIAGD